MSVRSYSNVSKIMALQVALNNVTTSVVVDDASGLPGTYPFNVALDYGGASVEIVSVTAVASNVLTVIRGQEDTVGTSHSVGAVVAHVATALDLTEANDHINSDSDVHGTGPAAAVVGTSTSQTLTNKTMSGALNTFTAIPASAVTGAFSNLVTNQTNASAPALEVNANVTPGVNVVEMGDYFVLDTAGKLKAAAGASSFVQRWYGANFSSQVAEMSSAGLLTCVGVTSTGAISAAGQTITAGAASFSTIAASGLITASAGVTVPSGQTLTMASGSTVTDAATGTYSGTNTFSGTVNLNATTSFGASSTVTFNNGLTVPAGESITINGKDMGWGLVGSDSSNTSTSSIGTSETAVLTISNATLKAGRAYEVRMRGGITSSADGVTAFFRLHKTNAAGATIDEFYRYRGVGVAVINAHGSVAIRNSTGGDLTQDIVLTVAASSGTVVHSATSTSVRSISLWDIGAASDHTYATPVT